MLKNNRQKYTVATELLTMQVLTIAIDIVFSIYSKYYIIFSIYGEYLSIYGLACFELRMIGASKAMHTWELAWIYESLCSCIIMATPISNLWFMHLPFISNNVLDEIISSHESNSDMLCMWNVKKKAKLFPMHSGSGQTMIVKCVHSYF